jgi:AAA domain
MPKKKLPPEEMDEIDKLVDDAEKVRSGKTTDARSAKRARPSPKPETINGDIGTLPRALEHLREKPIWVCWRRIWDEEKGEWTKPPYRVDNPDVEALPTDPRTLGSYDQAVKQWLAGKADGIGFALKGSGVAAIDLNHCCDVETNEVEPWAKKYLLHRFPEAYAEYTVSGQGIRILGTSGSKNLSLKFKLPNQSNGATVGLYANSDDYLTLSCKEIGECDALPPIGDAIAKIADDLGKTRQKQERQEHNGKDEFERLLEVPDAPKTAPTDDARPNKSPPHRLVYSSKEFVAGFVPPEYVVVGLLQRRFLYCITGQTGAGKTAVTLRLAASSAQGIPFAGRETKKVRVLYVAAENPDDVRMRWIALAQHMQFDVDEIEVYFTTERFKISQTKAKLRAEAENLGGEFGLVIIDTSPAFFEGDDENSRPQMGAHALLLRSLIDVIPGGPAVIANCHPIKNATADSLLPAGGGTFVNEVDGNITCAKTDAITELHWFRKFRGPDFAPMSFLIKTVTHQDLKDSDGRLIPTVICECLTDNAKDEIASAKRKDEDEILRKIDADPTITYRALAIAMGWRLNNGDPNKTKAERCVANLEHAKLIKETRSGRWKITPEGTKALNGEE